MTNPDLHNIGVQPGDLLAGKYRVERILGVGGMGVVVAAHHVQLEEKVALKFLLPQALSNPEAVARFEREARAAVKIKSEHVARVIDVGQLDNRAPYMVMEYLDGRDLSTWLLERGALPVEQAVEFLLQACEAIAEAHVLGIVHRDLKPANLFCIRRPDGTLSIKVLDFGISKSTGVGSSMSMTSTQAVMGSPLYMSPEQMGSSKGVDARADIWALGVILFELVTGRVPFEGEAITELVMKIVTAPAPLLGGLQPGAPPGLDPIIARCLEKDRTKRYASVSEFANDLIAFGPPRARLSVERIARILGAAVPLQGPQAAHGGGLAITGGAAVQASPAASTGGLIPGALPSHAMTDASWGKTGAQGAAPNRGSRIALILGGAAMLVLLGGGGALLLTRKSPPVVASTALISASPPAPPATTASTALAPLAAPPADVPSSSAVPDVSSAHPSVGPRVPAVTHPGAPTRPATSGASAPPAKPAAKASCDPPYFIDAAGHRQYKPECL